MERAASFTSLGIFVGSGSLLELGIGRLGRIVKLGAEASRLGMAGGWGFITGGSVKNTFGCAGAGAGVSNAGLAGGGESGSLSAAKPKRSFDGSFGADDLSGKGAFGVAPAKLPFVVCMVFFELD